MWLSNQIVDHLRDVAVWPEIADGRYTIVRPIGRGGMGTVYVARDEQLGREVALKVSNAPSSGSGLDRRLRREARVLATLDHPGIAPVHDAGTLADGRLFYVMKLVRGTTLDRHVHERSTEREPLTEAERLGVFERVAETVAFAHAHGIVHRDLKPSNVMVGPFGEVLVLDWGVARVLADASETPVPDTAVMDSAVTHATRAGTMIGTPGFMAPEQIDGDTTRVGPATDVYALGALLFWMLTGITLSAELASAPDRELRDHRVPRRLRAIVMRCLASRPEDRYAHAGEVADDVARYRGGRAVMAYPETVLDRIGRVFVTYRTFILIIIAYLVMRTIVALMIGR
jgi:eukaryotic-like serine/threonine-protein kinase